MDSRAPVIIIEAFTLQDLAVKISIEHAAGYELYGAIIVIEHRIEHRTVSIELRTANAFAQMMQLP